MEAVTNALGFLCRADLGNGALIELPNFWRAEKCNVTSSGVRSTTGTQRFSDEKKRRKALTLILVAKIEITEGRATVRGIKSVSREYFDASTTKACRRL